MNLYQFLHKNVKAVLDDDQEVFVKVVGWTSEADNEPEDDGNHGGEYISVEALKPTEFFKVGGKFVIFKGEIKNIEEIK